jgi:hypothetical protein
MVPCSGDRFMFILPLLKSKPSLFIFSMSFSAASCTLSLGVMSTANHGCPLYLPL